MKLSVNLNQSDYNAFRTFVKYRIHKVHWVHIVFLIILEVMVWRDHNPEDGVLFTISMAIAFFFVWLAFLLLATLLLMLLRKLSGASFKQQCGNHEFEVTEELLIEINDAGRTETKRDQIKKVYETRNHFFILMLNGMGHIIPKRDLPDHTVQEIKCSLLNAS